MITVKNKSKDYSPDQVKAAYVRYCKSDDKYIFCETTFDHGYDIRQGEIDVSLVPGDIQARAKELAGTWPSYVQIDCKILQK